MTDARTLIEGNERFAAATPSHCRGVLAQREAAASRHRPVAAVLACADARVAPELVFDQGVGSLFTVRVAGNVAARAAVASLELAATELGVDLVVVLGHEGCGAVTAAIDHVEHGTAARGSLAALVDRIVPSVLATAGQADHLHEAVAANVLETVRQLRTDPGPLGDAVRAGRVQVVGAVYDLETGRVRILDEPSPSTLRPTPDAPTSRSPEVLPR